METSTKLSKYFLKLADSIKANKNDQKDNFKLINVKNNIVYSTDGRLLLRCVLNTDNMPIYNLDNGYYDIVGNYIIRNDDFSNDWYYPDINKIMNCTFEKTFDLPYDKIYNLFCFTLSTNGILIDYVKYNKQLKQLFSKGSKFRIYFNEPNRMFMIRCQYPVCHLPARDTEIQLFIMPIKHDVMEIKDITYNPIEIAD